MRGSLFLISFSAIYLQIALVRFFSNAYYGNITYFIISSALLGFGASGTFLAVTKHRQKKQHNLSDAASWLSLLSTLAVFAVLPRIPLNLLYLLYDFRQILFILLYSFLLFIPFFFYGLFIGNYLITSENKTRDYCINLIGSGTGGLVILGLMYLIHPLNLPVFVLIPLTASCIPSIKRIGRGAKGLIYLLSPAVIFIFLLWGRVEIEPDQYKDISQYYLLEDQGQAEQVAKANSPYGRYEIWSSPLSHNTLFAGLNNPHRPPDQLTIFSDGNMVGSAFLSDQRKDTAILDYTIQSLPYRLYDKPSVLLVGDKGLINLLLARRYEAESITVLMPDKILTHLLLNQLTQWDESINQQNIEIIYSDYRTFFLRESRQFDIIHFAGAESLQGSQVGLLSFNEDFLLTRDSLAQAAGLLTDKGVLALSRGKSLPPRDNIKIASMMEQSSSPEQVRQYENYLAVISLLYKNPPEQDFTFRLEKAVTELQLTERQRSISKESSLFDLRPADDNRPFFHSFFRFSALKEFQRLFGAYWFRESHSSYIILAMTLLFLLIMSIALILVPHRSNTKKQRSSLLFVFPLIGFSYIFIELVLIQKMALFLGHNSFSLSLILSTLLLFSGLGSLFMGRRREKRDKWLFAAWIVITVLTISSLLFSSSFIQISALLAAKWKPLSFVFVLLYIGTMGFFMGFFFAPTLNLLARINESKQSSAWALNGFTSVIASPLALILSLSFNYAVPLAVASLFYLASAILFSCQYRKGVV